jgi:hypothetical protein
MFKILFDFSIAFLIVLVLIGTVWLVRLFRANRLDGDAARRPQSRRLAVNDAVRVDGSHPALLYRSSGQARRACALSQGVNQQAWQVPAKATIAP